MMREIAFAITVLLFITSCESEILQEKDLKLYGKWESLYSYGGIGGTYYEPGFDYLEIVKYGIYGIINNDDIIEVGKIEVISQQGNQTVIGFIKDDEYSTDLHLQNKLVLFNGNDTLLLAEYNMADGFTACFKRIKSTHNTK